jgi:hypothetical protein
MNSLRRRALTFVLFSGLASATACSGGGPGAIDGLEDGGAGGGGGGGGGADAGRGGDARGDGGTHERASDGSVDAPSVLGPIACGSQTCSATQYCFNDCCGGVAPPCDPAPQDGAPCPAGTHAESCGCRQDNLGCTPAPPKCVDGPTSPRAGCTLDASGRAFVCVCS